MKERMVVTVVFLTAGAVTLSLLFPGRRHTILLAWVLGILGSALLELNARSRGLVRERSRFDKLLEDPAREKLMPEDLKRLERGLGWMTYEPSYFDFRVRPILRDLIRHRVRERTGIDLETDPGAAQGLVPRELLDLLSARKAEELYGHSNIETHDIARMVNRIETL